MISPLSIVEVKSSSRLCWKSCKLWNCFLFCKKEELAPTNGASSFLLRREYRLCLLPFSPHVFGCSQKNSKNLNVIGFLLSSVTVPLRLLHPFAHRASALLLPGLCMAPDNTPDSHYPNAIYKFRWGPDKYKIPLENLLAICKASSLWAFWLQFRYLSFYSSVFLWPCLHLLFLSTTNQKTYTCWDEVPKLGHGGCNSRG